MHLVVFLINSLNPDLFLFLSLFIWSNVQIYLICLVREQEEFKDTKGVIRICKSKKNRQHNGQRKRTNNHLQNITIIKTKDRVTRNKDRCVTMKKESMVICYWSILKQNISKVMLKKTAYPVGKTSSFNWFYLLQHL